MDFISVKQSANCGDLLSMLPALRQLSNISDKKILIHQRVGMVGSGYQGAIHPFQDERGYDITFNDYMFEMVRPLIISQDWVSDFVKYEGQPIDYDFDIIRSERHSTMPYGSINRWPFYVFPQTVCDLSEQWLNVEIDYIPKSSGKILINRTDRYFNNYITYFFLKEWESELIFIGIKKEYDRFCAEWKLNIPYLDITDFLQLAKEINSCKFYIGNQSMAFQIAEGLKVKRILEVCEKLPNVILYGKNGYDFLHQGALEFFVRKLISE